MQSLKSEVKLMTEMVSEPSCVGETRLSNRCSGQVKCLDSFMAQQSRLVIIVDGLDSCEQDKVLVVLEAIQTLLNDNRYPFVVILAIDPHIIVKVSS